jgi:hypothetical protein
MGSDAPHDWYIKGARPGEFPPYDARYMLRLETIAASTIPAESSAHGRLLGPKRSSRSSLLIA